MVVEKADLGQRMFEARSTGRGVVSGQWLPSVAITLFSLTFLSFPLMQSRNKSTATCCDLDRTSAQERQQRRSRSERHIIITASNSTSPPSENASIRRLQPQIPLLAKVPTMARYLPREATLFIFSARARTSCSYNLQQRCNQTRVHRHPTRFQLSYARGLRESPRLKLWWVGRQSQARGGGGTRKF